MRESARETAREGQRQKRKREKGRDSECDKVRRIESASARERRRKSEAGWGGWVRGQREQGGGGRKSTIELACMSERAREK